MAEREAVALREAQRWRIEADIQAQAVTQAKRNGRKNVLLAICISVLGGLAVGVTGTLIIGSR
jgi:hypothetical protein